MSVANISGAQEVYVYQTSKKTLAVRNCLQLAVWDVFSRIHNPGGKKGKSGKDGREFPSTLRFTAIDIAGKGDNKQASFNLSPKEVRLLFFRLNRLNKPSFEWSADRLHAFKKGQDGRCPMNRLTIKRIEKDSKGEPYRSPWFVKFASGTAVPVERDNGSIMAQRGSWEADSEVSVAMSDDDYFGMLSACTRFLDLWEQAYGIPHLREGDVMCRIAQARASAVDENGCVSIGEDSARAQLIAIAFAIVEQDCQTKPVTTDFNSLVAYFSQLTGKDFSGFKLSPKKATK